MILGFIFYGKCMGQNFSELGKKINYSSIYRKAQKFTNIENALLAPEKVLYLKITVDEDGHNYQKFVDNHSKFINLRKLIIDNCYYQIEIHKVPDLSIFKDIEYLQVFCIPKLNLDKLSSLSNLKFLEINGCEINDFPSSILKLTNLECLNLSVNYLSRLPDNIGEMTNLKELELTNNCFDEVPKQIVGLHELLYLIMNNAEEAGQFKNGKLFCKNTVTTYPGLLIGCKKIKKVILSKVDDETQEKLKTEFPSVKFYFSK